MAILLEHAHEGTLGATPSAAGEGYTALSGAPTYVAGGVTASAVSIRYAAGAMYLRDEITAEYGRMYVRSPSTPSGDTAFCTVYVAGGATTLASMRWTSSGAITIHNGLTTLADTTAASTVAADTWYRIEPRVGGSTQEMRIYNLAGTLLDTLSGAAVAGTAGRWAIGHAHAGASASATDIDQVALGDAWIGAHVEETFTHYRITAGGVLVPMRVTAPF
jgi:hypothetical protein